MKKNWWKVLTVVLLFYTLFAGMTIPIGKGIISDPKALELTIGKENTISVVTDNTQYSEEPANEIKARVRFGEGDYKVIDATEVKIVDDRELRLKISIPALSMDCSARSSNIQRSSLSKGFINGRSRSGKRRHPAAAA